MTAGAVEPEAIEFAPLPAEADLDTAFDADHKAHAQLLEKGKQRLVCKSAIRREPDATRLDVLKDQFERLFDHGAFIQMHPAFEHTLVVSAPVDRDGASTDDQRDSEQVLLIFGRPVNGKADFTERRDLTERLMRNAFGQPFRREPLVVNQSREPFASGFLFALSAGQFRLAAGQKVSQGILAQRDHSKTKARHPQTNGICERFHRTMKDEFYSIAFRKKIYHSIEELQQDVDEWLLVYNCQRPHSGRYCYGKTPMQAFGESKHLAEAKMLDKQQALVGQSAAGPTVG